MSGKSLGEEIREELIRKAVIWGPAIGGGLLLGPVGIAVGIATTVAVVCSGGSDQDSKSKD
jgi:hypothetical protein